MSNDPKHDPRLEQHAAKGADGLDGIDLVPDAMIERFARAMADTQRREPKEDFNARMEIEYRGVIEQQAQGRLSAEHVANAAMRACVATSWRANDILQAMLAGRRP